MKYALAIIAKIAAKDGKAPEWVLLFAKGINEVEGKGKYLVDETAFKNVNAGFIRRGNDLVFDYEHQTIKDTKAPAAGWIKELKWDPDKGILARVEWTEEAAQYIIKGEYRYHSPVFVIRKPGKKDVNRPYFIHSVALTNAPRHNHLQPILAKLGEENSTKEEGMKFFELLFAALGLEAGASEEDVITAVTKMKGKPPETKEVIAKDILEALGLKEGDDASTVVASIHAMKQGADNAPSREEFDKMVAKLAGMDAEAVVAKAIAEGKVAPAQKDWATEYATKDLRGFETFVAKAPVVVPLKDLPGKEAETDKAALDEATMTVAKMMGVDPEDIKKYGTAESA